MKIDALNKKLDPLFKKYKIEKAILFGSLARNEASRHSDIDLILIQNTDLRFLDRYEGVLREFSQALPEWDVDLLIYTPEELAAISHRRFIQRALKEGIVLYESK
ncbi:MAG: nucleotidyltransferase domain-containing protein [Anaerolineae bacterium]|nr:nucleotidyltransferase domain-containing protein [Anaerolineae bacterium]MCI0609222.1 nucleotidyltransferase domain-containing protein [Anaerolineae bacterium]